jgi:hypothetical protein
LFLRHAAHFLPSLQKEKFPQTINLKIDELISDQFLSTKFKSTKLSLVRIKSKLSENCSIQVLTYDLNRISKTLSGIAQNPDAPDLIQPFLDFLNNDALQPPRSSNFILPRETKYNILKNRLKTLSGNFNYALKTNDDIS